MSTPAHPGELLLRRLRVGELAAAEAVTVREHTEGCAHCRARLRAYDDEQRSFESELSFERFSAGVTRAIRRPHADVPPPRTRWLYPALGVAAAVALVVAIPKDVQRGNRLKGGADMALRIAAPSGHPQRTASSDAPEPLVAGERVRIGYRSGGHPWVLAISIDARGEITPLYPEAGRSLPTEPGDGDLHFLPGSLEFTGRGAERVIVLLSEEPLEVDAVSGAARRAFEAAGRDLRRLSDLEVPGTQLHRTLLKPQELP